MSKIKLLDKNGKPMASSYRGATTSRSRLGGSMSGALLPHHALMPQHVREKLASNTKHLDRNNSIASSAFANFHTHIVNTGMTLNCSLNAKSLGISMDLAREKEEEIEEQFDIWASSFESDATGQQNFYQMQGTLLYEWFAGGDCFALTPFINDNRRRYGLAVRLIESERVSNPNNIMNNDKVRDGIELDRFGKPIAIHIRESFPNDFSSGVSFRWRKHRIKDPLNRRRVLHLWLKKWVSQYRGESKLAAVIEDLQHLTGLDKGEITTRFIQSLFSVFVTRPFDNTDTAGLDQWYEGEAGEYAPHDDLDKIILEPGLVQELEPGSDVRFADPNRNAQNYKDFVDAVTTRLSSSIGVPQEVLQMKFGASYSASRAALILAWESYKVFRKIVTDNFCRPTFELWLDESVSRGIIDLPNYLENRHLWNRCDFEGSAMPVIDEARKAKAVKAYLDAGITSRREESKKAGYNFDKIESHRKQDGV